MKGPILFLAGFTAFAFLLAWLVAGMDGLRGMLFGVVAGALPLLLVLVRRPAAVPSSPTATAAPAEFVPKVRRRPAWEHDRVTGRFAWIDPLRKNGAQ